MCPSLVSMRPGWPHVATRRLSPRAGTRHGTGPFESSFTSGSLGHHYDPVRDPSFSGFWKNVQNAKCTFEMLKWEKSLSGVCCWTEITGCQSVQWTFTFAYDYYKIFGLRILLRHLEFIVEQGHRVNWVSGSLDSRVTGSLGHKMWPSSISVVYCDGEIVVAV